MKRSFPILGVFPLLILVAAAGEASTGAAALDVIEGTLHAAECVGTGDEIPPCDRRALEAGQPGGVFDGQRFTVLLVDGRILGRTCTAGSKGRLRASGVLHQNGFSMSLFRLEQDCGQGWTTVDIPHTGTLADSAAGGDE